MKKFSKSSMFKIAGISSISVAWMYIAIQVLLGTFNFPAFGFFT